jgi:hypothetical protein
MGKFKSHFSKEIDLYFRSSGKYEHPDYGNVRAYHCFPVSSLQGSRKSCEEWSGKSQPTLKLKNEEIANICIVSRNLTYGNFYSMQTRSLSALLEVNPSHILEDNSTLQGIKKSSDGNYYFIVDLYEDEFYPAILENGMSKGGLIEGPFKFVYNSPGNLKLCYLNGDSVKGVISEEKYLNSKKEDKKKKKASAPKVGVDYLSATELEPGFVYERGSCTRSGIPQYSLLLEKSGGEYCMAITFNKLGFDTKSKNKISFSYAELKNSDNGEIINYPQRVLTEKTTYSGAIIERSSIFVHQAPFFSSSYFQQAYRGYYRRSLVNSLGYKVSTKDLINIKTRQIEFSDQDEYFKFLFNRDFFVQKCIDFYNGLQDKLGLPELKEDSQIINFVISNLNYKNDPIFDFNMGKGKDLINCVQRKLQIKNNLSILKVKGNPKFGSKHTTGTVFDSDLVNSLQKCYEDNKDKIVTLPNHKIW